METRYPEIVRIRLHRKSLLSLSLLIIIAFFSYLPQYSLALVETECPIASTKPTIDGTFSQDEWDDAFKQDIFFIDTIPRAEHLSHIRNNVTGELYLKYDQDFIYFCIIIIKDPENTDPRPLVIIQFDEELNGRLDEGEEMISGQLIKSQPSFVDLHYNGTNWVRDTVDDQIYADVKAYEDHYVLEYAIPLDENDMEDLDININNDVGFCIILLDQWWLALGDYWPQEGMQLEWQDWNKPPETAKIIFEKQATGIPGFSAESVISGLIISIYILWLRARNL